MEEIKTETQICRGPLCEGAEKPITDFSTKIKKIKEPEPFKWSEFLIKGEKLFNYMTHNYNSMINDNKLRHFEIIDYRDKIDRFDKNILDDLNDNYLKSIEDALIPWIENEYKSGNLLKKNKLETLSRSREYFNLRIRI